MDIAITRTKAAMLERTAVSDPDMQFSGTNPLFITSLLKGSTNMCKYVYLKRFQNQLSSKKVLTIIHYILLCKTKTLQLCIIF